MTTHKLGRGLAAAAAFLLLGLGASRAGAVPAFAIQTGQPCEACHVGGFGPQLTPFGRNFKIHGYTLRTNTFNVPVSAMMIDSYVRTDKNQGSAPAPNFNGNDNFAVDQISVFLAGGLGQHLGAFVQSTYDGVARAYHWDNLDLRAVTDLTVRNVDMTVGLSVNNAPTVQDAWNTLPAWGYPYTSSTLAPTPGSAPIIGAFAQNTLGLTAYTWIDSSIYLEGGAYASPGSNFLRRAGVDPTSPGGLVGLAPYARLAYQKAIGSQTFEVGGFYLMADLNPGRDTSTGVQDHYRDLGGDASYIYQAANKDVFTVNFRYTNEEQRLSATQALGGAVNTHNNLQDVRLDASYYWRDKIGATIGAFDTFGSSDALLYGGNRTLKPDSDGMIFQVDGTPFGGAGSPLGPRFNMRVGVQYVAYFKFDGADSNFDGAGRNAGNNNTLRVFTWFAY